MTLKDVMAMGLTQLEFRGICSGVLKWPFAYKSVDGTLFQNDCRIFLIAVLLKRVQPPLGGEQRTLLLQNLLACLDAPQVMLIFLDGRFFTHTGLTGFVSLDTGEAVEKLPAAPIMSVTYNLTEFIARQLTEHQNAADSPRRTEDPC